MHTLPKLLELVNAPFGFIWTWHGKGVAHLVKTKGKERPLCGERLPPAPRTYASQVGGYSAIPCGYCRQALEAMFK